MCIKRVHGAFLINCIKKVEWCVSYHTAVVREADGHPSVRGGSGPSAASRSCAIAGADQLEVGPFVVGRVRKGVRAVAVLRRAVGWLEKAPANSNANANNNKNGSRLPTDVVFARFVWSFFDHLFLKTENEINYNTY